MKKLPILRPTFDGLRSNDAIYVDKTEHVFNLTKDRGAYFYLVCEDLENPY
jgi:hypothetical protein